MATEWFCRIMGEEWGPMSAQELMAVARWGRLSRDDTVRRGNSGTWVRAEMVQGLFSSSLAAATTILSKRVSATAQKPTPAKRSVRNLPKSQYWVNIGQRIAGPFSGTQLRQLAACGRLKPTHLISKDRCNWVVASNVKGLSFGGANAHTETVSIRSALWLDQTPTLPDAEVAHYACSSAEGVLIYRSG